MKRGRAEVGHEVGHPSLLTKKEEGRRKTSTGAATAPELEKVSGVIGYLNRQAGTAFQAGAEGNLKLIVRLLRDGATSSDFKSVIDSQVARWKGNRSTTPRADRAQARAIRRDSQPPRCQRPLAARLASQPSSPPLSCVSASTTALSCTHT